jgi:hypothetical protein
MQNSVSAKNQEGNDGLVTPEMRRQIRELKEELDECDYRLSGHLNLFVSIREGLDAARQTARCLLTNDPFQAWEKVTKQSEEEFDAICGTSRAEKRGTRKKVKATAKVDKLITRQMRQQIVEAKKTLEDYANSLDQFFREVTKLKSLDAALELAEGLQCCDPLETWEARKEREEAEAEEDLD